MSEYRHILVAVDLTEESRQVTQRACALKQAFAADLSCVHVIEPLSLAYGGDIPMDLSTIQDQIQDTAKSHLAEFAQSLSISPENQHLIFGRPETEIHALAKEIGADLIVVGSLTHILVMIRRELTQLFQRNRQSDLFIVTGTLHSGQRGISPKSLQIGLA